VSRSKLQEHELAALRQDLPAHGLIAGGIGTVVFTHADGRAYEVEFMTADGRTVAVETLSVDQVEPVAGDHILHARKYAFRGR
jgi:hypothetical protein